MPRPKTYNYDVNRDYQTATLPRDTTERILYTYPDLTPAAIAEIRADIIEASLTPDRFGRLRSWRELALQYHVSLRSIVYAVNPGIERDVEYHQRVYGPTQRKRRKNHGRHKRHGRHCPGYSLAADGQ